MAKRWQGKLAGQPLSREILQVPDADTVVASGRQYNPWRQTQVTGWSGAVGDPEHAGKFIAQKLGDLTNARGNESGRDRKGRTPYPCHRRWREVGFLRSTEENAEQSASSGGGGGKAGSQGKRRQAPCVPDTEPEPRIEGT